MAGLRRRTAMAALKRRRAAINARIKRIRARQKIAGRVVRRTRRAIVRRV